MSSEAPVLGMAVSRHSSKMMGSQRKQEMV